MGGGEGRGGGGGGGGGRRWGGDDLSQFCSIFDLKGSIWTRQVTYIYSTLQQ